MVTYRNAVAADAMVLDDKGQAQRVWSTAGYARQPVWSRWVKPLS